MQSNTSLTSKYFTVVEEVASIETMETKRCLQRAKKVKAIHSGETSEIRKKVNMDALVQFNSSQAYSSAYCIVQL